MGCVMFRPKIENTKFGCKFFRTGFCSCDTGQYSKGNGSNFANNSRWDPIIEAWERHE
jgi:hypothetical protein